MVSLVLQFDLDLPWCTFFAKLEKVWIRADQSGLWGLQPPLVDQEGSGPP